MSNIRSIVEHMVPYEWALLECAVLLSFSPHIGIAHRFLCERDLYRGVCSRSSFFSSLNTCLNFSDSFVKLEQFQYVDWKIEERRIQEERQISVQQSAVSTCAGSRRYHCENSQKRRIFWKSSGCEIHICESENHWTAWQKPEIFIEEIFQ